MPAYTPETRQIRVDRTINDRVREYAILHGITGEEVYRRAVIDIAATPTASRPVGQRKVRVTPRVPDAVWHEVQVRSVAEKTPITDLVARAVRRLIGDEFV